MQVDVNLIRNVPAFLQMLQQARTDSGQTTYSVVVTVSNVNPILSNIAITDVDEDGVSTLTGNLADVGTEDSFTLDVDWGDSSPISTYSYPAGTACGGNLTHPR